jgi:hypothetical protein
MVNVHYIRRYESFINNLKNQLIEGYSENHHIVPRSLGGSDDNYNLIKLTARQHYIAHWMLARAYKDKMSSAFWFMSNVIDKKSHKSKIKVTSGMYDEARRLHQQANSQRVVFEETRQIISKLHKGKKRSAETRRKMSIACTGRVASEEHRRNLSIALTGKKQSEETKLRKLISQNKSKEQTIKKLKETAANRTPEQKSRISEAISQSRLGHRHTEETKLKMSLAAKGKKKSPEAVQKQKESAKANYKPKKWMCDKGGNLTKVLVQEVDKYLNIGYTLGKGSPSDETKKKLSKATSNFWKQQNSVKKETL